MPYEGLTILCTDIECDGTMQGPAIDLYEYLVTKYPNFQWIASGGVRDVKDLVNLQNSGVWASVAGRAILEGNCPPRLLDQQLMPRLPSFVS